MALKPRASVLNSLSTYTRDNIVADVIGIEGGYVNDPTDRGGETNWGITAATAAQYKSQLVAQFSWDGTMKNLTQPMASYIYVQEYWNKMSLDAIFAVNQYTPMLADLLFEAGVNIGWNQVAQYFQQSLNVLNNQQSYYADLKVDGNIGPVSVKALQSLLTARPSDALVNLLWMVSALIGARYITIAVNNESQEKYESGWQNRARTQYNKYVFLMANS